MYDFLVPARFFIESHRTFLYTSIELFYIKSNKKALNGITWEVAHPLALNYGGPPASMIWMQPYVSAMGALHT